MVKPVMLGVLDDASRVCCHGQWYYKENTQALVHALSQGIQKRGLPRALLDKIKNADRVRRALSEPAPAPRRSGIVPHLKALMAEYAATGLPPAYLVLDDSGQDGAPEEGAALDPANQGLCLESTEEGLS